MKNITEFINIYSNCHKNSINKIIHIFAVTAIMFSIVGLIYSVHYSVAILFVSFSQIFIKSILCNGFLVKYILVFNLFN